MSGAVRFGRQVVLTVGTLRLEVSSRLRVRFDVRRSFGRTANTARVEIFNLAEDTRGRLASETPRLVLEAGYGDLEGGSSVGEIFRADTVRVAHQRQGPDWVTEIQTADSQAALSTPVTVSIKPGKQGQHAIDQIGAQLKRAVEAGGEQLRQGHIGDAAKAALKSLDFPAGLQMQAPAGEAYARIAAQADCMWSCEGQAVQLLSPKEALPMPAVRVAPDTGLVGSPRRVQKAGAKERLLSGASLLDAGIQPGRRLLLDCAAAQGVFRVERVSHVGDTHGGAQAWVSRWVASPMG